jgi:carboxymethylenebutenolidase
MTVDRRAAVLLGLVAAAAGCRREAAAKPAPTFASRSEVAIPSGPYTLRGDLLIPDGRGPHPAIVYNHGSERDPSLRWMGDTAQWFQEQGFVVLVPYRRGCNGSGGPYWKEAVDARAGGERDRAIVDALELQADDAMAAVAWLARRPEVDPARIAVAGCSFGGIVSLLAAERGDGVRAAVDFAGASMTWAGNAPLRDRLKRAARAARAPVFFVQAANDFDVTPSEALSSEMAAAGRPHDKKIFPPHGTTPMAGHAHFCNRGQTEWGPDVLTFLRRSGVAPNSGGTH